MDGEVNMSHGDGDTIPEDLAEDYFPPNFKEYMLEEQLKWSRFKADNRSDTGWVFWSQHNHEIARALQKWMLGPLDCISCLVQFWAATKTLEGRTRLTTQFQPFALSRLTSLYTTSHRQQLCEYRMKMCSSEYNHLFYADAEFEEEQLGLPGRVFLHQFPEVTPYVKYYSKQEYPQRNLALRCRIRASLAVPVFEHSSQNCVGVLEMASLNTLGDNDWLTKFFVNSVNEIFQEHGLQCFGGHQACEVERTKRTKRVEGLTQAFKELKMALRSVCQTHVLPLAMTWVPCSDCNGLQRCKVSSAGVEFCLPRDSFLRELLRASKCMHLRKGLVAGRARSSLNMLYCPDITQLSLHDYPLVHYARRCNLSGWFTIYLLCKHTGNFIYVLEFFLSAIRKDDEETTLSLILGTLEEKLTTFRFASGKELGELIPVEVIHFQENQKIPFQSLQATRDFSMSSIPSSGQSSASVANIRPGSQDACMFQSIQATRDFSMSSSVHTSASVANTRPGSQDACMETINAKYDSDSDHSFEQSTTSVPMVTVKAKYASCTIKFKLSSPYRFVELQQKVIEWLDQRAGTCHVCYEDESGELILIACDEDLIACVETFMSLGNTSIVVFLEPKQPVTSLNPTN